LPSTARQAATLSIDPITPRAKPPPFFFTGKPNLYALYERLQTSTLATERRLAGEGLWPPLPGMPEMSKIGWKWKNQEEMLEIANVSVCVRSLCLGAAARYPGATF